MRIGYIGALLFGFAIAMLIPPTNESLKLLWVVIMSFGLMLMGTDFIIISKMVKNK